MARFLLTKGAAAMALASLLAACASGPADFAADVLPAIAPATATQPVRSAEERERLAQDLDSTARTQASAGRAVGGTLPSAMALAVIRQQQEEEARALLDAALPKEGTEDRCDPATDGACPPAP